MGSERNQSHVGEPGSRLVRRLFWEPILYSEQEKSGGTHTLNPLSGLTRRVPVNVPLAPLANVPRFNAMALPKPPIVSPVESLTLDAINPNPTIP